MKGYASRVSGGGPASMAPRAEDLRLWVKGEEEEEEEEMRPRMDKLGGDLSEDTGISSADSR